MLDFMRRNARSIFIQIAFFIIIAVFIFWGIGTFTSNRNEILAEVDGTVITQSGFLKAYQMEIEGLKRRFGEDFSEKLLEKLNLKERVLQRLIDRTLVTREARKLGLTVEDKEVLERIKSIPAFQRGGVFNKDLYVAVLRREGLLPSEFEEGLKEDLLIEKAMRVVTDSVKVTDGEVKRLFKNRYKKIKVRFVKIDYPEVRDAKEEELKSYFESHKESFRVPERFLVDYVVVKSEDYLKDVKVGEEEVKTYYEKNRSLFEGKRPIPFEKAKTLIEEILKKAKALEVAEKAATTLVDKAIRGRRSLKEAAPEEGFKVERMGPFTLRSTNRITMERALVEALSRLKIGEVSNPVKVGDSFYILELKDKEKARIPEFTEVKELVRKRFLREKARGKAQEMAREIKKLVKEGKDLKEIAAEKELGIGETGFFSRLDKRIPLMGLPVRGNERIFTLGAGNPSIILEGKEAFYVVELAGTKDPDEKVLEEKKEELRRELFRVKRELAIQAWLKGLRERADIRINREAL